MEQEKTTEVELEQIANNQDKKVTREEKPVEEQKFYQKMEKIRAKIEIIINIAELVGLIFISCIQVRLLYFLIKYIYLCLCEILARF